MDAEHQDHIQKLEKATKLLNESTERKIRNAPDRLDGQWILVLSPSAVLCQQISQVAAEIMSATRRQTDNSLSLAAQIPIIQINSRTRVPSVCDLLVILQSCSRSRRIWLILIERTGACVHFNPGAQELIFPTLQPAIFVATPLALLNAMDFQPMIENSIARGALRMVRTCISPPPPPPPSPDTGVCVCSRPGFRNIMMLIYEIGESNSQTILDEVDMLLTGGFLKPSWTVLDLIEKPYPRGVLPRLACQQWPVPSQIVLCGATVPNRGLKSVDQTLRERFPRLEV